MSGNDEPLTEARLARLLEARASQIEVQPDLSGVTLSPTDPRPSPQARPWWLAVAAAVGIFAFGALLVSTQSPRAATTASRVNLMAEVAQLVTSAPSEEMLVWMDPDATSAEIQAVARALGDVPAVERSAYIDRAAAYDEFVTYYADQPEILELVDPEDLPTYFEVDTAAPAQVADVIEDLPGVINATLPGPPNDQ